MTTKEVIRVGFFGKLPSRGDFVRSAFSRTFTQAWDRWLQPLLPAARGRLGEAWSEAWPATRPWRFAIAPGFCSAHSISGVWLASADKVGRDFPLTIAAEASAPCHAFLDAAEALGLEAIRSHMPPDTLAQRLARLPPPSGALPSADRAAVRWWRRREADGEDEALCADHLCADHLPDVDMFVGMLTP